MADVVEIHVRIGDEAAPIKRFRGRFAWTLAALIDAGPKGITTLERPAPRLSHYIFRLRRDGVPIATEEERHAGPFAGSHARYRLSVPVFAVNEIRR